MKANHYFREADGDGDFSETLAEHIKYMEENKLPMLKIYKAERQLGTGTFYCNEYQEWGEVGDSCGKSCDGYKPRNCKSGICQHHRFPYAPSNIATILTIDTKGVTKQ